MNVLSRAWWRAALARAAYTVLAAALPIAPQVVAGAASPVYAGSVLALAAVASLATSLAGLPELKAAGVSLWRAVAHRALRTAGQVAAPVLGAVVLLEDVHWYQLVVDVGGAVVVTLIRTVMARLPEAPAETPVVGASLRSVTRR